MREIANMYKINPKITLSPIIKNEIGFLIRDVITPDKPIAPPDKDKTI
jgi:hypothetical protein